MTNTGLDPDISGPGIEINVEYNKISNTYLSTNNHCQPASIILQNGSNIVTKNSFGNCRISIYYQDLTDLADNPYIQNYPFIYILFITHKIMLASGIRTWF